MKLLSSAMLTLLLLFLVIPASMSNISLETSAQSALKWDRSNSKALTQRNAEELKAFLLSDSAGPVQEEMLSGMQERVVSSLKGAPLSAKAMFFGGIIAYQRKDYKQSRGLLEVSLKRNPRDFKTILSLLEIAKGQSDYEGIVDYFDAFLRVKSNYTDRYMKVLLDSMRDPQIHPYMTEKMMTGPIWGDKFFAALLAQEGTRPDLSIKIIESAIRQEQKLFNALAAQSRLYSHLLVSQDGLKAHNIWKRLNFDLDEIVPTLNDPDFMNIPGPLPFYWQVHKSSDGYSEFNEPSGLYLSRTSNKDSIFLAQQLLSLPGDQTYMLSAKATGQLNTLSGSFYINLTCSPSERSIGRVDIEKLSGEEKTFSHDFNVPKTGCDLQRLQIFANDGGGPSYSEIVLNSLNIYSQAELSNE